MRSTERSAVDAANIKRCGISCTGGAAVVKGSGTAAQRCGNVHSSKLVTYSHDLLLHSHLNSNLDLSGIGEFTLILSFHWFGVTEPFASH